jgi:hypothetical protein
VSLITDLFDKVTVAAFMGVALTMTLCYLAVVGAVQGETFLAAVVGGAFAWAFGTSKSQETLPPSS